MTDVWAEAFEAAQRVRNREADEVLEPGRFHVWRRDYDPNAGSEILIHVMEDTESNE